MLNIFSKKPKFECNVFEKEWCGFYWKRCKLPFDHKGEHKF